MNAIDQIVREIARKSRIKMHRRSNGRNRHLLRQPQRIEQRLRALCEHYPLTCEMSEESSVQCLAGQMY